MKRNWLSHGDCLEKLKAMSDASVDALVTDPRDETEREIGPRDIDTMKMRRKILGDGSPPFIIAEVGSNWVTLGDCLMSIEKAKECGADAVKFQAFNEESLYGFKIKRDYPGPHELPLQWLPKLKEKADQVDIEFMCSAFSPELIEAVNPFVDIHKLASAEMCHFRMLEKLAKIGKPVFMSTGAHTIDEIDNALKVLRKVKPPLVLMYCVAAYPAQEINLESIPSLRTTFGCPIGYSDHSIDVSVIPRIACSLGAVAIEKHFTALPEVETPDRGHSLTPDQFKRMVGSIRGDATPNRSLADAERSMLLRHNRRLIAIKDIMEGDMFIEGRNFGIYRSLKDDAHALHPFVVNKVNGKVAKRKIQAGDGIGEGDF